MSVSASRSPARRIRRWLIVSVLFLGLLGLVWGLRLLLQPERMGALIVSQAESATGLRFELAEPARLGLFPSLHLRLVGVTIRPATQAKALLTAERVDLALPLSVIWSANPEIGRIDINAPDIHLPVALEWLAEDADRGPPEALSLPAFATEVRISQATLRADGFTLQNAQLELSPLRDGTPARLALSAQWHSNDSQAAQNALPFQLLLAATPKQLPDGLGLSQLSMALSLHEQGERALSLEGEIDLLLPQRINFNLIATTSASDPTISASIPTALSPMLTEPLTLTYSGAADFSSALSVTNVSATAPISLSTHLPDLLQWIANPKRDPLPPVKGRVALPSLDIKGVRIDGLSVELTADPPAE